MEVKNVCFLFKFMFQEKNGGFEKNANSFAAAPPEKTSPSYQSDFPENFSNSLTPTYYFF